MGFEVHNMERNRSLASAMRLKFWKVSANRSAAQVAMRYIRITRGSWSSGRAHLCPETRTRSRRPSKAF